MTVKPLYTCSSHSSSETHCVVLWTSCGWWDPLSPMWSHHQPSRQHPGLCWLHLEKNQWTAHWQLRFTSYLLWHNSSWQFLIQLHFDHQWSKNWSWLQHELHVPGYCDIWSSVSFCLKFHTCHIWQLPSPCPWYVVFRFGWSKYCNLIDHIKLADFINSTESHDCDYGYISY